MIINVVRLTRKLLVQEGSLAELLNAPLMTTGTNWLHICSKVTIMYRHPHQKATRHSLCSLKWTTRSLLILPVFLSRPCLNLPNCHCVTTTFIMESWRNGNSSDWSDISSINHLVMREFVSGSPRYHLAIKGVREQFVVLEQRFRTLEI